MDALDSLLAAVPAVDGWLGEQRRAAADFVRRHGLPDVRQEAWKYTSLAPLKSVAYRAATSDDAAAFDAAALAALPSACASPHRFVLVNGQFRADLSVLDGLPAGVRVQSLATDLAHDAGAVPEVFAPAPTPASAFATLNSALAADGAVIELAPGCVIEEPLHLVHVVTGDDALLCVPRVVVRLGRDARARVVEEYLGTEDNRNLTSVVTTLALGAGATLHHHRLQGEPDTTAHVGRVLARLEGNATLHSDAVAFGGALTRVDIEIELTARGARCNLNGLFAVGGEQHVDHHTVVDHCVGDTHSQERYHGILDGRSRGVFNGKVIVRPNAQGITARQASHNLLLSRGAEIDTKPELEIYADDVSCSHGATVGELDPAALFYLRSRGVPAAEARALLTYAFADKAIAAIPLDSLRQRIEQRFLGHRRATALAAALSAEPSS
ncbi:MAG: Fe-S cluster assembly protein SufD [Gammaproteobacteria bacterium]